MNHQNIELNKKTLKKIDIELGTYSLSGYGVKYVDIKQTLLDKLGANPMDRIYNITAHPNSDGAIIPYIYISNTGQWLYLYNTSPSAVTGAGVTLRISYI